MKVENTQTKGQTYGVLVSVGNYKKIGLGNLPSFEYDANLIERTFINRLKINKENIRRIGHEGYVSMHEFARVIITFSKLLKKNDTIIFYFSCHGNGTELVFSDGSIELQSIIEYIDTFQNTSKLVILDCCYAGNFKVSAAHKLCLEDTISSFCGHGIAVLASSSAAEQSRINLDENCSLYTSVVCDTLSDTRLVKKGKISLADISEEIQYRMSLWNKKYPDRMQTPIYRSSIGGTFFFSVSEDIVDVKKHEIIEETRDYTIISSKSLNTLSKKRECLFLMLKPHIALTDIPRITYEIVWKINSVRFIRLKQMNDTIWCYFGMDERDMLTHNYCAYSIWTSSKEEKKTFFRQRKDSYIDKGIYIFINSSYDLIKETQSQVINKEDYILEIRILLNQIVNLAEEFIQSLQEVFNQTISYDTVKEQYSSWIHKVKIQYLKLTDLTVPDNELIKWSNEVLDLAGWIVDIAIILEQDDKHREIDERQIWIIKNAVKLYYDRLESLKGFVDL